MRRDRQGLSSFDPILHQLEDYLGGQKYIIDVVWTILWICREIDEALRPGVYALIDVCSADDLQSLHAWFGGK